MTSSRQSRSIAAESISPQVGSAFDNEDCACADTGPMQYFLKLNMSKMVQDRDSYVYC